MNTEEDLEGCTDAPMEEIILSPQALKEVEEEDRARKAQPFYPPTLTEDINAREEREALKRAILGADYRMDPDLLAKKILLGILSLGILVGVVWMTLTTLPILTTILDPAPLEEWWTGILLILQPLSFWIMLAGAPIILFCLAMGIWALTKALGKIL